MSDKTKELSLTIMRGSLQNAKQAAQLAGFGYEVIDAINELISFAEFELDEMEVEYHE